MCLDGIVTLGLCPDDATPSSGLKLVDAAGITLKNLANTATETYISGVEMAMLKKDVAITLVSNEFIASLHSSNVVTNISSPVYDSSRFNHNESNGNYSGVRGVNIYKAFSQRSMLRTLYIEEIQLYPLQSGYVDIIITDGYNEYTYPVTLVANQVNTFGKEQLGGFPFAVQSGSARVAIDNTTISFAKSPIVCHTGCSGNANGCGYADGWNGTAKVPKEGYGINVRFKCDCDYTKILCDLSKSFSGELIWLKWQILILTEQLNSNRFNSWIIYNRDELKDYQIPKLEQQYNAKWNALMNGMPSILKTYKDECLDCRSIKWVSAI